MGPVTDRPNFWNFDLFLSLCITICTEYTVLRIGKLFILTNMSYIRLFPFSFFFFLASSKVLPGEGHIPRSGSIILSSCLTLCLHTIP
jgi:hypothetical protein